MKPEMLQDAMSLRDQRKRRRGKREGAREREIKRGDRLRANLLLIVIWCLLESMGNRGVHSCGSCPSRRDKRVVELN